MYGCRNFLKLDGNPFDDEDGTWNLKFHVYVPTKEYIETITPINLTQAYGSTDMIAKNLLRLAIQLKNIMMVTANGNNKQGNRNVKEYKLAKDINVREYWLQAVTWFVEGDLQSDISGQGNEIGNTKGRLTDLPEEAFRALTQTDLLFRGIYNYCIDPDDVRNGY